MYQRDQHILLSHIAVGLPNTAQALGPLEGDTVEQVGVMMELYHPT